MKNKTVAVYPYLPVQRDITVLNDLCHYIKLVQKEIFEDYVREHKILLLDHRSLDSIRKFEMEYIDGVLDFASFRVSINTPEIDSRYKTVSVFNNDDYLYTNNYSFRVSIGISNEYNIGSEYNEQPRISMESLHKKINPSFFSRVFDKFGERYFLNNDFSRNAFKRQIPFMS